MKESEINIINVKMESLVKDIEYIKESVDEIKIGLLQKADKGELDKTRLIVDSLQKWKWQTATGLAMLLWVFEIFKDNLNFN